MSERLLPERKKGDFMTLENTLLSGGNDSQTMAGEERELDEGVMPLDVRPRSSCFIVNSDSLFLEVLMQTSDTFVFGFQRSCLSIFGKR